MVNFSKSGIGGSWGVPGMRFTKTATGRNRTTFSIPGTGISHVTESGGKKQRTGGRSAGRVARPSIISTVIALVVMYFFIGNFWIWLLIVVGAIALGVFIFWLFNRNNS